MEYFQYYDGEKMGIKTINEEVIIPAIYDFVEAYSDGLFNVTQGDSHAYFDTDGKNVIPFQNKYESYGNFTEGLARVRVNEQWGYIDKTGKEVIKPQFYFAEEFSDGVAVVRNAEDQHGAIDQAGNLIIDFQFQMLSNFSDGYALFGDYLTYGLIDKSGKIIVPQEYLYIGPVENNKVVVQTQDGENYKEGVLTLGGSVEWNNNLDYLNEFNRIKKEFYLMAEALIQSMYDEGCPCEYQRFRDFIEWDEPISFMDQEVIFSLFSNHLENTEEDTFKCSTCGTVWLRSWEEYSIDLQVVKVKMIHRGNFTEKGAGIKLVIPVVLGFRGYDLEKLEDQYIQTDCETVMGYLKERG